MQTSARRQAADPRRHSAAPPRPDTRPSLPPPDAIPPPQDADTPPHYRPPPGRRPPPAERYRFVCAAASPLTTHPCRIEAPMAAFLRLCARSLFPGRGHPRYMLYVVHLDSHGRLQMGTVTRLRGAPSSMICSAEPCPSTPQASLFQYIEKTLKYLSFSIYDRCCR
jgi:hypothetical protein